MSASMELFGGVSISSGYLVPGLGFYEGRSWL